MKEIVKKYKHFFYLLILLIFIFSLYTQEKCFPKFGDIFGLSNLPIQSYGFFIAMAFIFGAIFLKEELKRLESLKVFKPLKKRKNKYSYILNLLFSFFFGYQITFIANGNYNDFLLNPEIIFSFHLNSGILNIIICLSGGVLLSIISFFLNKKDVTKKDEEFVSVHELIGGFTGVALISGILGAKLFYILENLGSGNITENLFSFGGLTFYGGLICGTLGVILYAKKYKIPILNLTDAFAPILMLAYGIGRVGCQVTGDGCWGIQNSLTNKPNLIPEWMWSCYYKGALNAPNSMEQLINPVFPTPIYETIICLISFLFLWSIRKKMKIPGLLFSIYLILNGLERFFIEKIRINEELFLNFTQGQVIAIILFSIGTCLSLYLLNNKKNAII